MLRNLIVLPDGTEIYSGTGLVNAIQNTTITECVNSGTELTLGSVCASMLEMKIITPGGGLNIAADTEITLYKVDDAGKRTKVGLFTMEKPTRPSANTYKVTAYDRVSWLDKDLSQWLAALGAWPYTLYDFAAMVCAACGLTLKNKSIPNGGYQIRQFGGEGITGRRLMQWVGEACGRFCRATADGEIEFAWYTPSEVSIDPTGDLFFYRNGLSYENYKTAAIEKVHIQLTDDDVGAVWPNVTGEVNTYTITGNYLLTTDTTEALVPLAQVIYETLKGVQYTPCKVSIPANLDIHAGNTVRITDSNGTTITAYVMTKIQTRQRDTLECTGSPRRDSSTVVNNETLKALSGKMLEVKKSVEGLSVKASNLETKIENIEGIDGSFFYIKYSPYEDGHDMTDVPDENTLYMGTCSTGEATAPTDYTAYTWCRVRGNDGADGKNGTNGTNGVSRYIHIRYSANSNGNPMTSSPSSTTKYIGTCVTASSTAPTSYASYKWVQCRGNDGTDGKDGADGQNGADGKDGQDGKDGADGKGIKSTSTTYQAGSSGTTAPTGTWSSSVPSVPSGQYLWAKTVITYTDNTSSTSYSVSRMGTDGTDGKDGANGQDGKDGADGKGIKSTSTTYQAGSSGTTAPTGTWSSSVPSVPSGQYLWAKTVITYTDNTSSTSYSVSRMGTDGTPGAPGADGKSKYFHVKYSDDGETFTSNGGETLGDWMGTCITDSEADPTAFDVYTWKKIVGKDGQPGIDGADGHDGVSSYFYVKFSANANGNPMTEIPTSGTRYMGVCSTTSPTAPTSYTAYTWTQCRGNDGENGIPGEPGVDGRTSYLHIKYSDDGKTFTANNGEDLGAWIGTLVDFNEMDSLVFSDYTWKKFTEDVDEELDSIKQTIHEQYTQIINDSKQILLSALDSYVETDGYEEFRQTVESQLQLLNNQMVLKFSEAVSQIEEINGDLQSKYNNITKYFSFDINGMTIGAVDNPNKVIVDNDEVSILVNNVPVQSFNADGKALTPELKVTRTFDLLGYLIEKDGDGNVNCEYVGG